MAGIGTSCFRLLFCGENSRRVGRLFQHQREFGKGLPTAAFGPGVGGWRVEGGRRCETSVSWEPVGGCEHQYELSPSGGAERGGPQGQLRHRLDPGRPGPRVFSLRPACWESPFVSTDVTPWNTGFIGPSSQSPRYCHSFLRVGLASPVRGLPGDAVEAAPWTPWGAQPASRV